MRAAVSSSNFRCIAASSSARLRFASSAAFRAPSSSCAAAAATGTGTTAPGAAAGCDDGEDDRSDENLADGPEPESPSAFGFFAATLSSSSFAVFLAAGAAGVSLALDDRERTRFASASVATTVNSLGLRSRRQHQL